MTLPRTRIVKLPSTTANRIIKRATNTRDKRWSMPIRRTSSRWRRIESRWRAQRNNVPVKWGGHCAGAELTTAEGRVILDFLSGYCVHNAGHNHPYMIDQLQDELRRRGPAMLQSHVPDLAGELAKRLCALAGGKVKKAFFAPAARASKARLSFLAPLQEKLACSMPTVHFMASPAARSLRWAAASGARSSEPMLSDTTAVPYNNLEALRQQLATKRTPLLCRAYTVRGRHPSSRRGLFEGGTGSLRAARRFVCP
jgi:acetylornithine/succinyldiaminopimelate/putrescine aminotransferase